MERQHNNQAHRQESFPDRDQVFAHASSEPESANRNPTPPQHGQNTYEDVHYEDLGPQQAAHQAARQGQETDALLDRNNNHGLYNIEGFVLVWFGAIKVSYLWHSFLMLLYYMLLFTIGISLAVLAFVGLGLRNDAKENDSERSLFFYYSNILSILSGLLFLLAAMHGGCMWAWRTSAITACCTRNIFPMGIVVFLLSLAHVSLMAALSSVLILYKYVDNSTDLPSSSRVLTDGKISAYWTLIALFVWGLCFLLALFPAFLLFRRKYKPRNIAQD